MRVYYMQTELLADPALFAQKCARLPAYRLEKLDRIRAPQQKRLSLAAGLLLRFALEEAGCSAAEPPTFGAHGKPLFPFPGVHVNLSHAGERVMCVLASEAVGCDVEPVRAYPASVAKRFFSQSEQAMLASEPDDALRNRLFFRLWTHKESLLKADGSGLFGPLSGASFHLCGDALEPDPPNFGAFRFCEYDPLDGYVCTVCTTSPEPFPAAMEVKDAALL